MCMVKFQKGSFLDALHRYSYTLKKFPKDPSELAILPDNVKAIIEMKFNLLLNLARCHRKLQVTLIILISIFSSNLNNLIYLGVRVINRLVYKSDRIEARFI